MDSLKSQWQKILTIIGKGTAVLLASASLVKFENGILTLEFPASAEHSKKMCEDRAGQIESVIREKWGKQVKIEMVGTAHPTTAEQPGQPKTRSQRQNEIMNDPAVKTVIMGLDATITDIDDG